MTLNFSKSKLPGYPPGISNTHISTIDVFHGFVFSLFFTHWLQHDGPKDVYLAVGGIQLACLLFTIPMYIYGKRARMWTVRKNLMEKF